MLLLQGAEVATQLCSIERLLLGPVALHCAGLRWQLYVRRKIYTAPPLQYLTRLLDHMKRELMHV